MAGGADAQACTPEGKIGSRLLNPATCLAWNDPGFTDGTRIYRTTDKTVLADPGPLGAMLLAAPCDDPPAGPSVYFYAVTGVCKDGTDGS